MKIYQYNAQYDKSSESFKTWKEVNEIIMKNMPPEIRKLWSINGYKGIAGPACEYFGIHDIYRDENQSMTFEFTEAQWVMFTLKWM